VGALVFNGLLDTFNADTLSVLVSLFQEGGTAWLTLDFASLDVLF
jgi:hypothetical protein